MHGKRKNSKQLPVSGEKMIRFQENPHPLVTRSSCGRRRCFTEKITAGDLLEESRLAERKCRKSLLKNDGRDPGGAHTQLGCFHKKKKIKKNSTSYYIFYFSH